MKDADKINKQMPQKMPRNASYSHLNTSELLDHRLFKEDNIEQDMISSDNNALRAQQRAEIKDVDIVVLK